MDACASCASGLSSLNVLVVSALCFWDEAWHRMIPFRQLRALQQKECSSLVHHFRSGSDFRVVPSAGLRANLPQDQGSTVSQCQKRALGIQPRHRRRRRVAPAPRRSPSRSGGCRLSGVPTFRRTLPPATHRQQHPLNKDAAQVSAIQTGTLNQEPPNASLGGLASAH